MADTFSRPITGIFAKALALLAGAFIIGAIAPATALADLSAGTIETYDELVTACQRGGTYALAVDITYDGSYPSVSASVTIDLNNHSIDANGGHQVFDIFGGSLTITGNGTITGGTECGVYVYSGSFTMKGGTISGNVIGVDVTVGETFTMEGGTISGNYEGINSRGEVYIKDGSITGNSRLGIFPNKGNVHVSGGTISGNGVGAIYCYSDSQLFLSGNPSISGTVWLRGCPPMVIEGALTYSNPVSVLFGESSSGAAGTFTSSFAAKCGADADPTQYFTSAVSGFAVVKTSDGEAAMAQAHDITCTVRDSAGNEAGGTVAASPNPAVAGQTVTVTVTPAEHYVFKSLEVKQGDTVVTASKTGTDPITYTFAMPDGAVTVTAAFEGEPCMVVYLLGYRGDGGTWADGSIGEKGEYVPYGSKPSQVPALGAPAEGWHEGFWKDDNNCEVDPSDVIIKRSPIFFRYYFAINTYTVVFEPGADGVEGSMDAQTFMYDETKALTALGFTREGYTFVGWKGSDGNTYTDVQEVQNLSDVDGDAITLTAQWREHSYTVSFAPGFDTTDTMADQAYTYSESKALSACGFSRTGYACTGWKGSDGKDYGLGATVSKLVAEDGGTITMTAQWAPITYTVAFEAGFETGDTMASQSFTYGETKALTALAFTREGYTFAGWSGSDGNTYTDGQEVQNLSDVDGDTVTLTATWEGNPAKITFDLAGGTLEGQTGTYVLDAKVGDVITVPGPPKKTNFQFQYWQGSEYNPGDEYTVTGDHTLTAVWKQVIPATGDESGTALLICTFIALAALATLVFALFRRRA